jgi:pilus assembly protein CpaB
MLALGCGLVASIGINQVLASRGSSVKSGETQAIYVALTDIEMGDVLRPERMKLEQWPKDKVPTGSLSKLDEVEERRARTKIFAGEPILDGKLGAKGEDSGGAAELIPKGFRTVAVKVDMDSGLAGLIKPGNRVDVLVFVQQNLSKGILKTGTHTVLQKAKVFAVDSTFKNEEEEEGAIQARTVSLIVTPEQAESVMLASQLGRIQLSLRNSDDDAEVTSQGTDTRRLLTGGSDSPGDGEGDPIANLLKGQPSEEKQPEPRIDTPEPAQSEPTLVADAGPKWRMTLLKGPDAVELEFREGQALPLVIGGDGAKKQSTSPAPTAQGVTLPALPGFIPPVGGNSEPPESEEETPSGEAVEPSEDSPAEETNP